MEAADVLSRVAATGTFRGTVSFNVVVGTGRVTAILKSTPEFIERYWEELRALGGWTRTRGGIQFREDVNVRVLEGIAAGNINATPYNTIARLSLINKSDSEAVRRRKTRNAQRAAREAAENLLLYRNISSTRKNLLSSYPPDVLPSRIGFITAAISDEYSGLPVHLTKKIRRDIYEAVEEHVKYYRSIWKMDPPPYLIDLIVKSEIKKFVDRQKAILKQKSRELGRPLTEPEKLYFITSFISTEQGRRKPLPVAAATAAALASAIAANNSSLNEPGFINSDDEGGGGAGAGAGASRGGRRRRTRKMRKNRHRR